jgi:hypothetical protein
MTADERKEYLTKIVSGEAKVRKPFYVAKTGKILEYLAEPDHNDRIRALAELNKMEGDYAPTKVAKTNVAGEDVLPVEEDELAAYISKMRSEIKSN